MIVGDEQLKFAPLSRDRHASAGHPLPDLRTIACKPGQASAVLTEHYRHEHPAALDASANHEG
jgi:hypothetical protein